MIRRQRGDTIVEVMVAFAVFTLIAVGSITIMNRGLALAQRSLEVTLVREQIDGQAELLRYVRDTSPAQWNAIKANAVTGSSGGGENCYIGGSMPSSAFYINITDAKVAERTLVGATFPLVDTYSKVTLGDASRTQGLWIIPVKISSNAYDMHIHACWDSVGSDQPVTLGTIVRLYDT